MSLDGSHRLGEYFKPFVKYETPHSLRYVYFFNCLSFLEVNIEEGRKIRCRLHLDIISNFWLIDSGDMPLNEDEPEQDAVIRGVQKILEAINTLKRDRFDIPLIIISLLDWWVRTGSEFFKLYYSKVALSKYDCEMSKLLSPLGRLGRISHCQEAYEVKGFIEESLPFHYQTPFVFEAVGLDGTAVRISVHRHHNGKAFHCSVSYNEVRSEIRAVVSEESTRYILHLIAETYSELYTKIQAKPVEDFGLRLAVADFEFNRD